MSEERSIFATWPERDAIELGLFDRSPRGLLLTRPDGIIVGCNPALAKLLGYMPSEIVGRHFNQLTHPEDAQLGIDIVHATIQQGKDSFVLHKRYLRKDGTHIWMRLHGAVVRDAHGKVTLFVVSLDDQSEERQREAERRLQAERQAAMQAQIIAAQRDTLQQLSAPLMPIRQGVLAIPLIGAIDRERAHQLLQTALNGVSAHRCRTLIVDITGVPRVDEEVAALLVRLTRAVRLLGAEIVLTGIAAEVAQCLVTLGIELGELKTMGSFGSAIAAVFGVAS